MKKNYIRQGTIAFAASVASSAAAYAARSDAPTVFTLGACLALMFGFLSAMAIEEDSQK